MQISCDDFHFCRTILQPGNKLLAAGYCLYGGQTNLVLTLGNGVHGFTFDTKRNDFMLTQPNMRVPRRGNMYSANEANSYAWDGRIQDFVDDLKIGKTPSGVVYDYRYNGALIADIHNILHHGG
jgi:fructose-1,6-bisphosphatase I